jgi:hypothetical protein
MRYLAASLLAFSAATGAASAQMTFNNLGEYCKTASEVSTPSLMARTRNLPRSQAEALMSGMTDPAAIRMAQEVVAFAYSHPAGTPVEQLRAELNQQCLARKIFVQ